MDNMTRRLFIRHGVTAGAAFAATSATAARIELPVDFMLAQLGAVHDRLRAEFEPLHEDAERRADLADEQAEAEGVHPSTSIFLTEAQKDRFWQIRREHDVDAAVDAAHEASNRVDAVSRQIRAIQPATVAGVKVWAKATQFDCLYGAGMITAATDFRDWDWQDECIARLLLAIEGAS